MLNDQAPKKSTAKAPPGALADRSYQKTRLDVAAARAMINAYRKQNGLKPLTIDAQLTRAAKAHSRDLAKWDRISHYGSDGSNPWDRVRRAGYKARLAAENVGTGQATLKEVFAGWKKSPGHNKNLLLKDAKHMGIALVHDGKTEFKTFWTLVLGSRG
ncbi:MAG: CAP domain-containing protein [Hyphomicrobiaceae bacterium]